MTARLRFIRPDVDIVDAAASLTAVPAQRPGAHGRPDSVLHTCLLLVLVKEMAAWLISVYHNVWRSAGS